eukprot:CAMPEP_0196575198 /NCGR_PEP_ID=MMETSP1081-20130531/4724_1 /TAXON_ID=36882 /ORGANISM="Pyramimonas amylifera, Strain CCMP720" /LENGTH=119 /DNA_ID=CAMNT_0041893419 /DNA_START=377 /DNA_END=732 /DNA_ORIENTATION=-
MQKEAEDKMANASKKTSEGTKQEVSYLSPEERMREMEKEAAETETLSTPHTLELFSPSKINVFLRIIKRREDGFHDLASLFHVIDFGDQIKFSKAPTARDSLTTNHPGVPLDDTNLIIR